ncbi:MAG: NUDIX domain-containing protein [Candidatus Obscuribacterales bacterium]|nr:NUDIX domain-containing protein [Candidatus Obscuribacterales bacterium]
MTILQKIKETLEQIFPFDKKEEEHLLFTKKWVDSGAGVFRIAKPATPDPHLVAYFLLLDPMQKKVLLVDHRKAGLWLPAGGHVEVNEHPRETVKREISEELNVEADFLLHDPFFLTVTKTVGQTAGHTDVSIWYLVNGSVEKEYRFDQEEFKQVRWFSSTDIPYECSDPHMQRCIEKLRFLNQL